MNDKCIQYGAHGVALIVLRRRELREAKASEWPRDERKRTENSATHWPISPSALKVKRYDAGMHMCSRKLPNDLEECESSMDKSIWNSLKPLNHEQLSGAS